MFSPRRSFEKIKLIDERICDKIYVLWRWQAGDVILPEREKRERERERERERDGGERWSGCV